MNSEVRSLTALCNFKYKISVWSLAVKPFKALSKKSRGMNRKYY